MTLVSPDGRRYLDLGDAVRQPRPFHYRWLLPWVLGDNVQAWVWMTRIVFVALCGASALYTESWAVAFLPLALAGLTVNLRLPILVDLPAMLWALLAANFVHLGYWPLAIPCALIAGCIKETSPVFAALYAWNPILLLGLLAPALRHLVKPGDDRMPCPRIDRDPLLHPIGASRHAHEGQWLNPLLWLLPWGPLLIGLGNPTWQVAATVAVAYGQCLIATDSVRLYVWAWPVLAARTFDLVPSKWWGLVLVLAFANPFKSNGL